MNQSVRGGQAPCRPPPDKRPAKLGSVGGAFTPAYTPVVERCTTCGISFYHCSLKCETLFSPQPPWKNFEHCPHYDQWAMA
eukprot:47003-Amphidinium_carterae.1